MKYIRVALTLKNKEYARDLARRLSEISDGLEIEIIPYRNYVSKDNFDIIVTDKNINIFKPVGDLFNNIVTSYQEQSGEYFISGRDLNLCLYTFRSETGGSGTSSIAICFAKSIALLPTHDKVLYISSSSGINNLNHYIKAHDNPTRTSGELSYLIRKGKSANLNNYVTRDEDGVDYLLIQNFIEPLIEAIPDISDYSHVVIDLGTNRPVDFGDNCHNFLVKNVKDSRTELYEPKKDEITIFNNCEGPAHGFHIPFSPEDFSMQDGHIEILKEGNFYRAVRNIARDIK